jgi:hypothetical protein
MKLDELDHTLFIEQEDGAVGDTFRCENVISGGDLTMRPEVTEQRVIDPLQRISPGFERRNWVDTDTQDLGI